MRRVAFLGVGNMGEALVRGMLRAGVVGGDAVVVCDARAEVAPHHPFAPVAIHPRTLAGPVAIQASATARLRRGGAGVYGAPARRVTNRTPVVNT